MEIKSRLRGFLSKYSVEAILGLFIFLSVILSFGLGYLTASKVTKTVPIVIEKCS